MYFFREFIKVIKIDFILGYKEKDKFKYFKNIK